MRKMGGPRALALDFDTHPRERDLARTSSTPCFSVIRERRRSATMNLFDDHLVEDDRSPTLFLTIGGYRLGLLAPKPAFFLQVIILLLLQMAIANILAVLCYYGIEKNRHTSFLVTFGIVLPFTTWTPFYLMNVLDIRSTVLRMGLVPLPICVQLKCLQGENIE